MTADTVGMELRKEDIQVEVYRHGIYPRNACHVRITHLPTGLVAECGTHRSELQNKDEALRDLREQIAHLEWTAECAEFGCHDNGEPSP